MILWKISPLMGKATAPTHTKKDLIEVRYADSDVPWNGGFAAYAGAESFGYND